MNRVIKFRAWSSIDKIMLCSEVVIPSFGVILESENHHVMQFTGLTDKNGVEIYEGDIVVDEDGVGCPVEFHESLGSCGCCGYASFEGSGFAAIKGDGMYIYRVYLTDCEVIGNIYQNPELLNQ